MKEVEKIYEWRVESENGESGSSDTIFISLKKYSDYYLVISNNLFSNSNNLFQNLNI